MTMAWPRTAAYHEQALADGLSCQGHCAPRRWHPTGSLSGVLDKAAAHAEAKKIDPAVLLITRLYPDMYPLAR
jgi:hypothetical protein